MTFMGPVYKFRHRHYDSWAFPKVGGAPQCLGSKYIGKRGDYTTQTKNNNSSFRGLAAVLWPQGADERGKGAKDSVFGMCQWGRGETKRR